MGNETQVQVEPADHVVQFYERDADLIETVGDYLGDGLRADEVAIVIATEAHTSGFEAALSARGVNVQEVRESGGFIALDAGVTLSSFMTDDGIDAGAFDEVIGGLVRHAARSGRRIRAYGEMVALLWDAGHIPAAIELESLWNDLGRQVSFSLFCAYPAQSITGEDQADAVHEVCHLHSAVVGQPSYLDSAGLEEVRQFAAGPRAPTAARRFVVDTLKQWGRGEYVNDAALIVTELATNAVIHAQSNFSVAVTSPSGGVRVAVGDASRVAPILGDMASTTATSGRGVALMAALAHQWGTDLTSDGKVVWAEFRRGLAP